jgi:hypothetical protein
MEKKKIKVEGEETKFNWKSSPAQKKKKKVFLRMTVGWLCRWVPS